MGVWSSDTVASLECSGEMVNVLSVLLLLLEPYSFGEAEHAELLMRYTFSEPLFQKANNS